MGSLQDERPWDFVLPLDLEMRTEGDDMATGPVAMATTLWGASATRSATTAVSRGPASSNVEVVFEVVKRYWVCGKRDFQDTLEDAVDTR